MPLLLLLAVALAAAAVSGFVAWGVADRRPAQEVLAIGGGALFAVLTYLVRTNAHLLGLDRSAARWGSQHAAALSTHGLNAVTHLGSISTVLPLAALLAAAELRVARSRWAVPFLAAVIAGDEVVVNSVKVLVDRVRPTLNPVAATLGPSFPSGHSANAAAFYAAAALLIGRRQARPVRAVLVGAAVGIAMAVAASRVLLDLHWLTDVIAGLAVGWAWFAVCALAFGGRILRFGPPRPSERQGGLRR